MARSSRLKAIPEFTGEGEERRFWETHDSADYIDWSEAGTVRFPNLKPSTETISLRLPAGLLADLKVLANKRDVPYQSLLKVFLADRVAHEWRAAGPRDVQRKTTPSQRRSHSKARSSKPSEAGT